MKVLERYWEARGELDPEGQKSRGFEKEEGINSSLFCVGSPSMVQIALEAHQLSGGT